MVLGFSQDYSQIYNYNYYEKNNHNIEYLFHINCLKLSTKNMNINKILIGKLI